MVVLRKQSETTNVVTYKYYPNGGIEYGSFSVNKDSLEVSIKAIDPIYPELFFFKALTKVKEMIANNDCKDEERIIWY